MAIWMDPSQVAARLPFLLVSEAGIGTFDMERFPDKAAAREAARSRWSAWVLFHQEAGTGILTEQCTGGVGLLGVTKRIREHVNATMSTDTARQGPDPRLWVDPTTEAILADNRVRASAASALNAPAEIEDQGDDDEAPGDADDEEEEQEEEEE